MNSNMNRATFDATMGKTTHNADSLSLTLSAARAAASEMSATMKDKEARKRRAKKRRLKREQRAIDAAEAAAAKAGVTFTGTMKRNVLKDVISQLPDDDDYAEDEFEKDVDEDYADDFEEVVSPAAAVAPRRHKAKVGSSGSSKTPGSSKTRRRTGGGGGGGGKDGDSLSGGMEAISVGADATFEATLGGKKSKKSHKKHRSDRDTSDVFGDDQISRQGLPGRRAPLDSEDDEPVAFIPTSAKLPNGSSGFMDDQLPALNRAPSSGMPTARGTSPHSSGYTSDALPNIGRGRRQ